MADITIAATVHSCVVEKTTVRVTHLGNEVDATVPRVVIEATWDDGEHSHTFRLPVMGAVETEQVTQQLAAGEPCRITLSSGAA